MRFKVVNRWYMLLLKPSAYITLFCSLKSCLMVEFLVNMISITTTLIHGIVIIFLNKVNKYTVLNLCLFVCFLERFLLKIKVYVVIHFIGSVWFMAYNSLMKTF